METLFYYVLFSLAQSMYVSTPKEVITYTTYEYNYDKLLAQMRHDESRYDETGVCQIWSGGTYGKYQMDPRFAAVLGYTFPQPCEKHDEIALKGYQWCLQQMDNTFGGRANWEFKTIRGIYLTKTNVIEAMWGAPYGTLQYLKGGYDWGNGYWSVSSLLKKYEKTGIDFYETTVHIVEKVEPRAVSIHTQLPKISDTRIPDFISRYRDQWLKLYRVKSTSDLHQ